MKRVLSLILSIVMLSFIVTGCSKSTDKTTDSNSQKDADTSKDAAGGDDITLGVAALDLTSDFFVSMIEGGDEAAAEEDVEVLWKSADSNLDKQIALIENFIQQGVDCILIDPYDSTGLIPVCEQAAAAGIPVISMGNFIDSEAVTCTLYNDYQDTYTVGKIMAEILEGKGEVAVLYGAAGNFVSDERQRGFEEAIAEYPDMKCTSLPVGWDTSTTLKTTQDLLASNPNIVGIHSFYDGVTTAVYRAVDQAGKTDDIIITSYDGSKEGSQAVIDDKYLCTVLTGAKRVGYWDVKMAVKLANGEELEQKNYLKSHLIMKDDLKEKVEGWGIGYDGMSIITPETGITMFDDMSQGFDE